jgi:hypothetical protein
MLVETRQRKENVLDSQKPGSECRVDYPTAVRSWKKLIHLSEPYILIIQSGSSLQEDAVHTADVQW